MSSAEPVDQYIVQIFGGVMILGSLLGILINFTVFLQFLKLEKSSFYIMCISKTISNSLVFLTMLCFNGPSALLYHYIGPNWLNLYLNHATTSGLYLQGPLTQTLISINRFIVVWFSLLTTPKYSTPTTVISLSASWLLCIYLSLMIGFDDKCLTSFNIYHLNWDYQVCSGLAELLLGEIFYSFLICLGFLSNLINILLAVKLFIITKSSSLSSENAKRRRRANIRIFVQNCFQDWIYVVDIAINRISWRLTEHEAIRFGVAFSSAFLVYGVDGVIMWVANRLNQERRRASVVQAKMFERKLSEK